VRSNIGTLTRTSGWACFGTLTHLFEKRIADNQIDPFAKPEVVQFADALPKTRSGKIMRRILRKIAEGAKDVGDVTTLADPAVVKNLMQEWLP
jgi:acyl-CoA synthetase (AMP-forming)/AMP-acid ligase II